MSNSGLKQAVNYDNDNDILFELILTPTKFAMN